MLLTLISLDLLGIGLLGSVQNIIAVGAVRDCGAHGLHMHFNKKQSLAVPSLAFYDKSRESIPLLDFRSWTCSSRA
jgi:hypothetical protein